MLRYNELRCIICSPFEVKTSTTYFSKEINQLNVASRRKPNSLSKSLKLEITKRTDKHFMADRSRTPYPTSMKRWERLELYNTPEKLVAKKRKIIGDKKIATIFTYLISFSSLDSGQFLVDLDCKFFLTDLIKVSEFIFKQVNWFRVVLNVLGKKRPAIFRNAFTEILQARIEELLKQKTSQKIWNIGESDIINKDNNSNGGVVDKENRTGKKKYGNEDRWVVKKYLADEEVNKKKYLADSKKYDNNSDNKY